MLGDTGCRGWNCKNTWGWPDVSRQAAGTNPDVILHVGDYFYREHCSASDCGKKWAAWESDFFRHAKSGRVLTAAPWIFVRGNHEDCGRGWRGSESILHPSGKEDFQS